MDTQALAIPSPASERRLPGDLAIWFFICAELLAFCVFFAAYAFTRAKHVELFNAEQLALDRNAGALNTILLLTASYFVVRAVQAAEAGLKDKVAPWLAAGFLCGCGFVAVKLVEYADKLGAGITLSTSPFYMFYLSLTFFHFMHVLLGLVILAIIGGSNILLMPANSGRLTVEEFAENFNQMARVTDSPLRLHSNGAWVRDSFRGYAATLENAFPSRLHALLLFATKVDAENFRTKHPSRVFGKYLVRARSKGTYTVSFHDSSWLDYLRLPHSLSLSSLDEVSNYYWKGTLVEEIGLRFMDEPWWEPPVIEALFQGKLEPVSMQPQMQWLPGLF